MASATATLLSEFLDGSGAADEEEDESGDDAPMKPFLEPEPAEAYAEAEESESLSSELPLEELLLEELEEPDEAEALAELEEPSADCAQR